MVMIENPKVLNQAVLDFILEAECCLPLVPS